MADPISGNDSVEDTEENESNVVALVEKLVFIGSEIRQMRKARMMTLKQLARDSQTSVSHLSAIERGTWSSKDKAAVGLDREPAASQA